MSIRTYSSMLEHPGMRLALQVLGIYMGLSILRRWPPMDLIVVVSAALIAGSVWALEYQPALTARASASPAGRKWLECVAAMSGQSMHAAAPPAAPHTLLTTDFDFEFAASTVKEKVLGHDLPIDRTFEHIRRSIRVRAERMTSGPLGPLAAFLYVGASGTGKRLAATAIGSAVFGRSLVAILDASAGPICSSVLRTTAKQYPKLCLVIENVERGPKTLVADLIAVMSGEPLRDSETGSTLDLSGWILFLLVHKDAETLSGIDLGKVQGSNGSTILADQLHCDYGLDPGLVWRLNDSLTFLMPGESEQAKAVLLAFHEECRTNGIRLAHVAPEIIAREVQETRATESFELLPGRVRHRLREPIYKAISRGESSISLETTF